MVTCSKLDSEYEHVSVVIVLFVTRHPYCVTLMTWPSASRIH